MNLQNYKLNELEQGKLKDALQATLSIPLIDSIEDFIWEAIFCHVMG
jgi:hypothetical protein